MDNLQLSLWSKEELDIFAPRKKTKKEIFEKRLLERAVLSDEDLRKYNFPLNKEHLVGYFKINNFEERIPMSPGVPQIVLTALSQYSKKGKGELLFSDLIIMYNSIEKVLSENGKKVIKKFRKTNNLNFFGGTSYTFMKFYVDSFI